MAFQITDDILDYVATSENFGKTVGTDISGGKQTLPFIHALSQAPPQDRARMEAALGNEDDIPWLIGKVQSLGGIERGFSEARGHVRDALEALGELEPSSAAQRLRGLVEHIDARTY
jgi:octaprenyl-diphosphate synthase